MKQKPLPSPHHHLPPMWVGIQPSEGLSGTKTTVPGRRVVPGLAEHSAGSIPRQVQDRCPTDPVFPPLGAGAGRQGVR